MGIQAKIIIGVILLMLGFGSGWHFRGTEDASTSLSGQKQEVKNGNTQNGKDAAQARAHEEKREKVRYVDRIVYEKVAVAAASPDYQTCQLKPQDLDLLNQAIGGPNGTHP